MSVENTSKNKGITVSAIRLYIALNVNQSVLREQVAIGHQGLGNID